tara:strand:+ start:21937 stop:22371 length:435 start_codon:yes stop_codon:yes gene_type:complete
MTVCEATEELLKYYKDNDVFVLSKDVSKVLLISEDEDAELAAIRAALNQMEEHKVISREEVSGNEYFILNKSLQSMSQDMEIDLETANLIASSINQFCAKTETFDNDVNALDLRVKDLRTLALMATFLLDGDKEKTDDADELLS